MQSFPIELKLLAAPDQGRESDRDFGESAIQACREAERVGTWQVRSAKMGQACHRVEREPGARGVFESIGATVSTLEIASVVKEGLPILAGLLGAWLQARYGRKVRLRVGEIEAEAGSADEVERLLERARAFQAEGKAS